MPPAICRAERPAPAYSSEGAPAFGAALLPSRPPPCPRLASTWPAYDKALTAINVPHEGYIYPNAVHGFNCDATPERYNKAAADLAWGRTIGWFNKYLRS